MSGWWNSRKWVMSTGNFNGTDAIGYSFVFLAYILHPAVEAAYKRVRAYNAWRAIERREPVEVTKYPLAAEMFGGRRKWDVARAVAVLLVAFSLASCGLELQLGLANIDEGPADILNRPPPVFLRSKAGGNNTAAWQVMSPSDGLDAEEGSVDNMLGTWTDGFAKSRYHIDSEKHPEVNGAIRVAWWSNIVQDTPGQFYNLDGYTTTVEGLQCSGEGAATAADIYIGDDSEVAWGTVMVCENGPTLTDDLLTAYPAKGTSPPVIILTGPAGDTRVLVEESSSYPSFLYSVWVPEEDTDSSIELHHAFHVASTTRLAEAVVTGIVHASSEDRPSTGGECFALLRQYSEDNPRYAEELQRASPFGEHPTGDSSVVTSLSQVEAIEAGIELNVTAMMCGACLAALTVIGIAASIYLRSKVDMDIFDRDELIRTILPRHRLSGDDKPPEIRIFVRQKKDGGNVNVFVDTVDEELRGCARILRRGTGAPAAVVDDMTLHTYGSSSVGKGPDSGGGCFRVHGNAIRDTSGSTMTLGASKVGTNGVSPSAKNSSCAVPPASAPPMGRGHILADEGNQNRGSLSGAHVVSTYGRGGGKVDDDGGGGDDGGGDCPGGRGGDGSPEARMERVDALLAELSLVGKHSTRGRKDSESAEGKHIKTSSDRHGVSTASPYAEFYGKRQQQVHKYLVNVETARLKHRSIVDERLGRIEGILKILKADGWQGFHRVALRLRRSAVKQIEIHDVARAAKLKKAVARKAKGQLAMELRGARDRHIAIGAGCDAASSIAKDMRALCDRSGAVRSILHEAILDAEKVFNAGMG